MIKHKAIERVKEGRNEGLSLVHQKTLLTILIASSFIAQQNNE